MTLLEETIAALADNGKKPDDVLWCSIGEGYFYWDVFVALSKRDSYNSYGKYEINMSLKVVGVDWWLERADYDGAQWWEYKTIPVKPTYKACPAAQVIFEVDRYD